MFGGHFCGKRDLKELARNDHSNVYHFLKSPQEIIKKGIMDPFDHRNLDQDVPHFKVK